MCKQIQRCYAFNRRATTPLQVYFKSRPYSEEFSKDEVVYLTSESTNVLETLDPSKVYIIGGLIDHNQHKGLCLKLAEENGVNHARLPIDEYIDMKTRKVLTINHVFQILVMKAQGETWTDVLMSTIAPRKGATAKVSEENVNSSLSHSEADSKES